MHPYFHYRHGLLYATLLFFTIVVSSARGSVTFTLPPIQSKGIINDNGPDPQISFQDTGSLVVVDAPNYKAVLDYVGSVKGTLKELYNKNINPSYNLVRLNGIGFKFKIGSDPGFGSPPGYGYVTATTYVSHSINYSENMVKFVSIMKQPPPQNEAQNFLKITQRWVFYPDKFYNAYEIEVLSTAKPLEMRVDIELRQQWCTKEKWFEKTDWVGNIINNFEQRNVVGTNYDSQEEAVDNVAFYSSTTTIIAKICGGRAGSNFWWHPWVSYPFTEVSEWVSVVPSGTELVSTTHLYTGINYYDSEWYSKALIYQTGWKWSDAVEFLIISNDTTEAITNNEVQTLAPIYIPP